MQKLQRCALVLLSCTLLFGFYGCNNSPNGVTPSTHTYQDVLTQKTMSKDKIPVTILVKYAFSINIFEQAAEAKFPQLDIIQVGNYTGNMGLAEYEARLSHGDLTDIVMTWPLAVGEEYWSEQLIDLSSLPLTSKYNTAMLSTISKGGKLYYLPGPSQVRSIVYNKTLFKEYGWEVPTDFESFIALCKEIEATGIRSLQLGLGNSEVLDTAFVGYGYESAFSSPQNTKMIEDYNNGLGSFGDNFTPALATFQRLIDEGILKKEDLSVYYQDREQMLFTRKCAMTEDSVLITRMGEALTGTSDEFALMPFFNPGTDADWSRLYPVCYIGLNKQLEKPENKEKYDLIMELLEYISTPEGQAALAGDTGAMISSLNGVPPPALPEIEHLMPSLTHGRYAAFPTLKNAQDALRKGLAGMVEGTMTADEVIALVDAENAAPPIPAPSPIVGNSTEDFSLLETGNFIADALRKESGCEIALFMDNGKDGKYNGKGVSGRLYQGDVTSVDIARILPDLKHGEKGVLVTTTMSGENLIKTLEYAIPVDNNITGWFYYFSGLNMEYDPCAEPGTRIQKITDSEGNPIDPEKIYSIAAMDETLPKDYLVTIEETDQKISEVLAKTISEAKTIAPAKDGRFILTEPYR